MTRNTPIDDNRKTQVIIGLLAILAVAGFLGFLWWGRRLPGFAGEIFGKVVGLFSTPLLMEPLLAIVCLIILIAINGIRQRREGDEFVYLEKVEGPDASELPESKRWVVYKEQPADGQAPDLITRAEGAIQIADHAAASEALSEMSEVERNSAGVSESEFD